ncbi:asparagine synthase (glutamine-hydrolyzing) [Noviherbaspirillum galbum]|uniref:asparagine synthase (glutamine-hydrolyzing) n=1 Tax=Noviherbaspirillum galbum TaxID=2709383 RepID=A0A6B3SX12_9BURK|nr:asparagine synthase (glutamine-hydrolyzing) [Noviherbaspirillum galbum]NEX64045.1 asparagine synthase (glutamine-hydrolyzing) [Noviherbaspirillum galbum]
MCGIAGIFSRDPMSPASVQAMTSLLRHRGPDDEGYVLFGSRDKPLLVCSGADTLPQAIGDAGLPYAPRHRLDDCTGIPVSLALGHRRLAIVDLSAMGHQPMCTPDQRYWIVHNGEIYNHIELRRELEACGHRFFSHSDTEVILAAYAEWGPQCLSRFDGMWAFAIYDVVDQELFLARDRFGIKPLYYWVSPCGTFCFASEIKAFTAFPGWSASLDHQAAYDYLAWGLNDQAEATMFAKVKQLEAGHYMRLNKAGLARAQERLPTVGWYKLEGRPFSGSRADAAVAFREHFIDAVRLHLRADVPVGSCLSGGLDSSSIVCVMNRLLAEEPAGAMQQSFSACAEEGRYDERKWIAEVVRHTGVQSHLVFPMFDKLFFELPLLTWQQDEPFGSTSVYAQWMVFQLAARHHVKVMLDGQGADEMLAGYHAFFGARFASLLRAGKLRELWKEVRQTKSAHGYSELEASMQMANVLLPDVLRQPLRAITGRDSIKPSWLDFRVLEAETSDPGRRFGHDMRSVGSLSRAQLTHNNLQRLLHWEDRNSMAHSIESRVPFLDHRLVEFSLGLPDEFKLSDGVTKRVLRSGMSGFLPDAVRDRPDKMGFETPEEIWIRKKAPDTFRRKMRQAIQASAGIFSADGMRLLEDVVSGKRPFNFAPWRIINFAEWLEVFSVKVR